MAGGVAGGRDVRWKPTTHDDEILGAQVPRTELCPELSLSKTEGGTNDMIELA